MRELYKTIKGRRQLSGQLSDKLNIWMKMSDDELTAELQKLFPSMKIIVTRDECFKYLVMDHVEKMVDKPA